MIQLFQQRNLYKKIFGGFLMRSAFELAWANAASFRLVFSVSFSSRPFANGHRFQQEPSDYSGGRRHHVSKARRYWPPAVSVFGGKF